MPILKTYIKFLGALTGIIIFVLIYSIPSLSTLPIISMLLCLIGFLFVVIVSWWGYHADRMRAIKKAEDHRRQRREQIIDNIDNPTGHLGKASKETLEREEYSLRADAQLEGFSIQTIEQDIKNPTNFNSLSPLAKTALQNEHVRLKYLDIPLKKDAEDSAVIVGTGAVFGIINGFGIFEALESYFGSLNIHVDPMFNSLTQIVTLDLSHTFRIVGFLATIIPFIHGFVLTLTSKWYHDPITNRYHLRLAYLFFIAIFIHTALFLLLALNVENISVYILYLWSIFVFNIFWLAIQLGLTYKILKRTDAFLHEWLILNFITIAYLSVFILAYPDLLQADNTVGYDIYLNLQIALVLTFRTVSDYVVGWRKIYNK